MLSNRLSHRHVRTCLLLAWTAFGYLSLSAEDLYDPPEGFYNPAENLLGASLRTELHDLIDDHTGYDYDALKLAIRVLDANPDNPDEIILLYSGISVPGNRFNTDWNREHVWPQSFGADSDDKPGYDFHHLYPADPGVNSSRSNLIFDWSDGGGTPVSNAPGSTKDNNSFEPRDEDKGRVARAMLYMDLRYESSDGFGDFVLAETANQASQRMAKLSTLLEWNRLFPPDERERRRNHLVDMGFQFSTRSYRQGNRNPFVDFPDLADALFIDDRVAWGAWRWANFSVSQLSAEAAAGPFDDPDEDLLVNLLEFSANLDPVDPVQESLLTSLTFPGAGTQLRYTRLKGFPLEGLTYTIERSATPLREETWMALTESDWDRRGVADLGMTELVTISMPVGAPPGEYRLRVERTLGDTTQSAVFDPARTFDPGGSIFIYETTSSQTGFKEFTWMDGLLDDLWPWVYHRQHGWLYFEAERDDAVWFYDGDLEAWFFTTSDFYPYLLHADSGEWLFFETTTEKPDRLFYSWPDGWISEADFLSVTTQ